jgi:TonB family protein
MRRILWFVVLLALATGTAWAQLELPPSANDGPMNITPAPPKPDKDGAYSAGPGIVTPIVIDRAPVTYPPDAPEDDVNGVCVLSLVIDADGTPTGIQVVQSHGQAFDNSAIEAVKESKFQAGTLDGKPVPVRVEARVRFFADGRLTFPRIVTRFGPNGVFSGNGARNRPYDKPPIATYAPPAEFSEKARKAKFNGVVIVSCVVTEEGLPTDVQVTKSVGMGLDEKAVESVSQFRFKPATKDGAPVAAKIFIEVNFRTY